MKTLVALEMSVGVRSAARLLVLRSREDIGGRREIVRAHAPGEWTNNTLANMLREINADGLCLACEKERETRRGVLRSEHTCSEVNPGQPLREESPLVSD